MNLGTVYYIVGVLDSIRKISGSMLMIIIFVFIVSLVVMAVALSEEDERTKESTLPFIKKSIYAMIICSFLLTVIPNKKDMIIILSANYVNTEIIQNEKVKGKVFDYLDLIDRKVTKFLKEE